MATQAYRDWVAAGEPWRLATPVKETRDAFIRVLGSKVAPHLGTLGDVDGHLAIDHPEDHAPFSQTAWPVPLPGYVVCALDIMDRPDLGLDCDAIFAYTLAEARAGRMPWLKYLIWQAKIYDVRNQWKPQTSHGHFDHIHESVRSDWIDKSIGSWSPLGGDTMEWTDNIAPAGSSYTAKGALFDAVTRSARMQNELFPQLFNQLASIRTSLSGMAVDPAKIADALAEPLADAVVSRLPTGTLTKDDVKVALREVLKAGVDAAI